MAAAARVAAGRASAGDLLAAQRVVGNHAIARAVVQRTPDDARQYCAKANIAIPQVRSGEDWIDLLLRLQKEKSPHVEPLKAALLKDEEANFASAVQARLGEGRGTASRAPTGGYAADDDSSGSDSDEEYVDPGPQIPKKRSNKRQRKVLAGTQTTLESFKEKGEKKAKRRKTPVTGKLETIDHVSGEQIQRPTEIEGYVEPGATSGRPSAPEPLSVKVGIKWKEVGNPYDRNTGIVDAQKGHIMALELAGPDQPWNIVPQWGNWQGNGRWRNVEKQIYARAVAAGQRGARLRFHAAVHYKAYVQPRQGTRVGLTFPSGFTVTITEEGGTGKAPPPEVIFDGEQSQDVTDFKISERQFAYDDEHSASEDETDVTDAEMSGSDEDSS